MWRWRPVTFVPPSSPCSPPCSVVLTDWTRDEGGAGSWLAPDRSAHTRIQVVVDLLPRPIAAPGAQLGLGCGPGTGVARQQTPLTAAAQHVEAAVEDPTK